MEYLTITRAWVERFVIALNLCPFAAVPFRKDQIRFVLEESSDPDELIRTFLHELDLLHKTPSQQTETTLIVHPNALNDFSEYNDLLGVLEDLLFRAGLTGVFQIASFHPDYQFAGSPPDDPANYTNRSPYPMLHLLREESITKALEHFPEPDRIPEVNIEKLREMGVEKVKYYWKTENEDPAK